MRLVHKAKASHIGSALSIADLLAVMISNPEIYNLSSPEDPDRDRLLLSKGHACVSLYSALCIKRSLFRIRFNELWRRFFTIYESRLPFCSWCRNLTGSLGHALPIGCGKALAAKCKKKTWHTFVILSDGELQEGSNWEALMFAGHHSLSELTIIIDFNNLQSLTTVENTLSLSPLNQKLESFGWHVISVDGHCHQSLLLALEECKLLKLPVAIIMNTTKGKGISFMEDKVEWHYKFPSDDQLNISLSEICNP